MLSAMAADDGAQPRGLEDRSGYYKSSVASHRYDSHRPHPLEPPRPMEPRPTLSSSLAESHSATLARRDSMRVPHGDSWSQGQSLPGLRDILSPTPPQPHGYGSSWGAPAPSPPAARHSYEYFRQAGVHPPMALLPPTDRSPPYASQHLRRYEPAPLDRRPSMPAAPYPGYAGPPDYAEHPPLMHGHARPAAYPSNGYASHYAAASGPPIDNHSHGGHGGPPPPPPMGMFERPPPNGVPPTYQAPGSEGQKKYIGVETTPEGTSFHCYEGGFRIPTHVDGEQVNPAWGLTKANKPRKRLALACLECREKKIKCEPGTLSCVQCEKAKRICRRAPQQTQPDTLVNSPWVAPQPSAGNADVEPSPLSPSTAADEYVKRMSEPHTTPPVSKRPRTDSPRSNQSGFAVYATDAVGTEAVTSAHTPLIDCDRGPVSFNEDPFKVNPAGARYLLELYFAHSESYSIFPRRFFQRWATTQSPKTANERLVLFAMLAYGSLFVDKASGGGDSLAAIGQDYARLAADELKNRFGKPQPSPFTSATHIILGLYWFANNQPGTCWDHGGAGMTIIFGSLVNHELEQPPELGGRRPDFGFSPEQYGECSRRCLWAAFMLERLGSVPTSILKPQDICLRLPCSDEDYENGRESTAPLLANGIVDRDRSALSPDSPVSHWAWMVVMTSILGDVLEFTSRSTHRPQASYIAAYEPFYADVNARLANLMDQLPPHLRYSPTNLDRGIQGGYAGVLIALHSVRHYATMYLNRRVRHAWLPKPQVQRNILTAWRAAMEMVSMMCDIQSAPRHIMRSPTAASAFGSAPPGPQEWTFTISYAGHAAVLAVDIVTAGGKEAWLKTVRERVGQATVAVAELGRTWKWARHQERVCGKQHSILEGMIARPANSQSCAWLGRWWGLAESVFSDDAPSEYPMEWDCTYGHPQQTSSVYFDALKDED